MDIWEILKKLFITNQTTFKEVIKNIEQIKQATMNFSLYQQPDPQQLLDLSFNPKRTIYMIQIVSNARGDTEFHVTLNDNEIVYKGKLIHIYPTEPLHYLKINVVSPSSTCYGTLTIVYFGSDIKLENKILSNGYLSELQEELDKIDTQIQKLEDIKSNTNSIYASLFDVNSQKSAIDKLIEIATNTSNNARLDINLSDVKNIIQNMYSTTNILEKLLNLDNIKVNTDKLDTALSVLNNNLISIKNLIDSLYTTTNILEKLLNLDSIKTNTDKLDTALSSVKASIDNMYSTTGILEKLLQLDNIKTNTDKLDTALSVLNNNLTSIKTQLDNMYSTTDILEKLNALDKNLSDLYNKLDSINSRLFQTLDVLGQGYDYANSTNRKIKVNSSGEIVVALP